MEAKTLYLYEFRYRCPLRKRWVKAEYRATLEELGERSGEGDTIGEPERRVLDRTRGASTPYRKLGERQISRVGL